MDVDDRLDRHLREFDPTYDPETSVMFAQPARRRRADQNLDDNDLTKAQACTGSVHVLMVPLNTIMPSVAARKPCSDADRAPIASPSRPPLSTQARGAGRAREVEVFRNAVRPVVADANVHLRACLARIASTHVITGRPSRHEVRPPSSRPKPSHVTR